MIAFPVRLSIYKRSPPYLALLYTQEVTTISCFVVYTREGLHSSQGQSFCSSSGKGTLSCLQLNTILQLQKILLVCGWPKAYVLALNSIGAVLPEEYNYRYLALWTFGTQIIQFFLLQFVQWNFDCISFYCFIFTAGWSTQACIQPQEHNYYFLMYDILFCLLLISHVDQPHSVDGARNQEWNGTTVVIKSFFHG